MSAMPIFRDGLSTGRATVRVQSRKRQGGQARAFSPGPVSREDKAKLTCSHAFLQLPLCPSSRMTLLPIYKSTLPTRSPTRTHISALARVPHVPGSSSACAHHRLPSPATRPGSIFGRHHRRFGYCLHVLSLSGRVRECRAVVWKEDGRSEGTAKEEGGPWLDVTLERVSSLLPERVAYRRKLVND
jgi:hypothetical protein